MPVFILKYMDGEVKSEDFSIIGRTIKDRGSPIAIRYAFDEGIFFEVNLVNGRFCLCGLWINPRDKDKSLVDLRNIAYRPIWKIHWVQTFAMGKGPLASKRTYRLGWQITLEGHNIQRCILIHQNGEVEFG